MVCEEKIFRNNGIVGNSLIIPTLIYINIYKSIQVTKLKISPINGDCYHRPVGCDRRQRLSTQKNTLLPCNVIHLVPTTELNVSDVSVIFLDTIYIITTYKNIFFGFTYEKNIIIPMTSLP